MPAWVLPEAGSIRFSVPRRHCVLSDRGPGLGAWELRERGPGTTPAPRSSSPPTLGSAHSSCPGSSSAVAATAMPAAASGAVVLTGSGGAQYVALGSPRRRRCLRVCHCVFTQPETTTADHTKRKCAYRDGKALPVSRCRLACTYKAKGQNVYCGTCIIQTLGDSNGILTFTF